MIEGIKFKIVKGSKLADNLLGQAKESAKNMDEHLSKITPNSAEALAVVLNNKIGVVRPAYERGKHFFGRLVNKISMAEATHIEVDGNFMITILKLLDEEVEVPLNPKVNYLIPFVEAEKMAQQLAKYTKT